MSGLAKPKEKPHNIGAMRVHLIWIGLLTAFPAWGARFQKIEITILPRSEGRVLVDIRGTVEEALSTGSLTVLRMEGIRRPTIKFFSPDTWKWETRVDAVELTTAVPSGVHTLSLQVEGLRTGALRVTSDLPASGIRLFLPEEWSFPGTAVDRIEFHGRKLTVYQVSGGFPLVIPLGKGKPMLFFLIAGGAFLLALIGGSLFLLRRRRHAPVVEEEPVTVGPEEEPEEEEEVEPEEVDVIEPPAITAPSPPPSPTEPSILTDPFAQLGVVGAPSPEETGESGEVEPPPGETLQESEGEVDLTQAEKTPREEEDLLHLGLQFDIPAEEPGDLAYQEEKEENTDLELVLEEEKEGPVSIEQQLLAEKGEARSVEAELLGEPSLSDEPPQPLLPEESPSSREPEPHPTLEEERKEPDEESSLLLGTPAGEKVEASPLDMLDQDVLTSGTPLPPEEPPEPGEETPTEEEDDLYVELDEAFLSGQNEVQEVEKPASPDRSEPTPASPPPPPSSEKPSPAEETTIDSPSESPTEEISKEALRETEPPPIKKAPEAPPPPPPKAPPKKPESPPSPLREGEKKASPSPKQKPSPSREHPPGTSPPASGKSTRDREALIREWLMKRKKRKGS